VPPPSMTVGLARGVKVPLLVWTRIFALDDGYVAFVRATSPNHSPMSSETAPYDLEAFVCND
jgi:hypothetical protein